MKLFFVKSHHKFINSWIHLLLFLLLRSRLLVTSNHDPGQQGKACVLSRSWWEPQSFCPKLISSGHVSCLRSTWCGHSCRIRSPLLHRHSSVWDILSWCRSLSSLQWPVLTQKWMVCWWIHKIQNNYIALLKPTTEKKKENYIKNSKSHISLTLCWHSNSTTNIPNTDKFKH